MPGAVVNGTANGVRGRASVESVGIGCAGKGAGVAPGQTWINSRPGHAPDGIAASPAPVHIDGVHDARGKRHIETHQGTQYCTCTGFPLPAKGCPLLVDQSKNDANGGHQSRAWQGAQVGLERDTTTRQSTNITNKFLHFLSMLLQDVGKIGQK